MVFLIQIVEFYFIFGIKAPAIFECHFTIEEASILCGQVGKIYDLDTCSCKTFERLQTTANQIKEYIKSNQESLTRKETTLISENQSYPREFNFNGKFGFLMFPSVFY